MFDMPPEGIIVPSAREKLVRVSTNAARNITPKGRSVGSLFRLSGKCLVLASCQGGCPCGGEAMIDVLLVFPEDAWPGSDFFHVDDFYPEFAPPDAIMRIFQLRPIAVPKGDCEPLPDNTLFFPKAMADFIPKDEDNE